MQPKYESPFDLDANEAYAAWRARKLDQSCRPREIVFADAHSPSAEEQKLMAEQCDRFNFALFRFANPPADPENALRTLGHAFGLDEIDANLCSEDSGLTEITVKETETDNIYIPYTNRPIGWHCDGYYNPPGQEIHGMLLYCAQPAAEGGENALLDHEIAYIRLRDQNPEWIRALMAPDAFTIPANVEGGKEIRAATSGPVFSVSNHGRNLHMRYSMRQRNVIWADTPATREAAAFLLDLFSSDEDHILRLKMQSGQGVLCNNILHMRSGFSDAPDPSLKRVMYRARYHDRVAIVD
jgi:alpha-ketoglutarate-dependent taurine dioxygenase